MMDGLFTGLMLGVPIIVWIVLWLGIIYMVIRLWRAVIRRLENQTQTKMTLDKLDPNLHQIVREVARQECAQAIDQFLREFERHLPTIDNLEWERDAALALYRGAKNR